MKGIFNLTLKNEDGSPKLGHHEEIIIDKFSLCWFPHLRPHIDLAIIPIGPILNKAENEGKDFYYIPLGKPIIADEDLLENLPSMEEIVVIGYPNGILDAKHTPLL